MTDAPSDRGSLTWYGTWWEPQGEWLPIARAVFRFAIVHPSGQRSAETHQDDSNPFSIEAFEKFKSLRDKTDADIVDAEAGPLSLHNLTLTLRDQARAHRAEIDLDGGNFKLFFVPSTGGAAVMGFAPWHLAPLRRPVEIDPRLELEARFNKGDGLITISDEEAKQSAQRYEAARAAASLVWNQLMLPDFARSVSAGRIKLYARAESRVAKFRQLPADIWSNLKVEDWQHGTACDPEGVRYYSIHAAGSLPLVPPPQAEVSSEPAAVSKKMPSSKRRTNNARGRPKEYTWDTEIKAFALALVDQFGVPSEDNKKLPRNEDLVKAVQNKLAEKDLHPGDSTVRRYVSKWLSEL